MFLHVNNTYRTILNMIITYLLLPYNGSCGEPIMSSHTWPIVHHEQKTVRLKLVHALSTAVVTADDQEL